MSPSPRVLQVSTADVLGGAERIAQNLHQEYARRGLPSAMAVGRKLTDDPGVFTIPNENVGGLWRRYWWSMHRRWQPLYRRNAAARLGVRLAHRFAEPLRVLDDWRGIEDFRYPGTQKIVEACPFRPDIVHCHNLHGKYFDLRFVPALSRERPVFMTLHDTWMLAGHCAHSFECERWRSGCGECPDLSIYPPLRRDGTAHNWAIKQRIFSQSRLYVATPSHWLMNRVGASMLTPGCAELRVIPNGVDVSIYSPGDRRDARQRLQLPQEAQILLFAGYRPADNPWKDFSTLQAAVAKVRSKCEQRLLVCLAVGGAEEDAASGDAFVQHVPFVTDEHVVADYYRAADVYVHAAKVDTFPNSVLEALACGTPVVATAVGGVPEQIVPADAPGSASDSYPAGLDATGVLVPPADADAMANAIHWLFDRDAVRAEFARNAVADVARRFTLSRQADTYIAWYDRILDERAATVHEEGV